MTRHTQRATHVALAVAGVIIGALIPLHHAEPGVTLCHTQTQTHCLWINGSATWR